MAMSSSRTHPWRQDGASAVYPHRGTAPPHPRAGTGDGRPHRGPRAAGRAGPRSPQPPRSPGTRPPPACASSVPHPSGYRSWLRPPIPGPRDIAQVQPGRAGAKGHHVHRSPLVSRNELTRDSAGHPGATAPRGTAQARYRFGPEPIAPTMLLQIAQQDIGQLTDIQTAAASPRCSPGSRPRRGLRATDMAYVIERDSRSPGYRREAGLRAGGELGHDFRR
jgi:hypothetical protein